MHQFGEGTHVGNVRDNNEDSYVCDPEKDLWVVADGMGGLGFGEVASAISTYTIQSQLKEGHGINQAIELAHKRIKEFATNEALGTNMGTTLVLLLSQGSLYNVFWVGDSRAYLFDGKLSQITVDHSLVQTLIEQGEITEAEAQIDPRKNAVTRALGVQELETVRADSVSDKWLPNQKILLCSDGLTDCVDNKTIQAILSEEGSDQSKVDKLINKALKHGGKDNITVLIISAPTTARESDSDTHVPENLSDNTETGQKIQSNDATKLRRDAYSNQTPVQLEIPALGDTQENIPTLRDEISPIKSTAAPNEVVTTSVKAKLPNINIFSVLQKWGLAGSIGILMLFFARFTTADKQAVPTNPFATGELIEQQAVSSMPPALLMPEIEWPELGSVIQLGIYSRLAGAESQQNRLSQLGFSAYIEKKLIAQDALYAVLLGPFSDHSEQSKVSRQLALKGLSYFERPDTRY